MINSKKNYIQEFVQSGVAYILKETEMLYTHVKCTGYNRKQLTSKASSPSHASLKESRTTSGSSETEKQICKYNK